MANEWGGGLPPGSKEFMGVQLFISPEIETISVKINMDADYVKSFPEGSKTDVIIKLTAARLLMALKEAGIYATEELDKALGNTN